MRSEECFNHRKLDFLAVALFTAYCVAFAVLRLTVSPTMDLDEAEQFVDAQSLALGYPREAPLFTWLVVLFKQIFGEVITSVIALKYLCIWLFYLGSYGAGRILFGPRTSLLVCFSLWLFFVYSYEFNRHLTHTALVTALASLSFYQFLRLFREPTLKSYLVFGVLVGLGFLSKYNFILFFLSLVVSSLVPSVRRQLSRKGVVYAVLACLVIVLPHGIWTVLNGFPTSESVVGRTSAGELSTNLSFELFSHLVQGYVDLLIFGVLFSVFFWKSLNWKRPTNERLTALTVASIAAIALPIVFVFGLQMGTFSSKWLSPIYFLIPLSLFSFLDLNLASPRLKLFSRLCVLVSALIFIARAVIGFGPSLVGKAERIHLSFYPAKAQLANIIPQEELRGLTFVSNKAYYSANLAAHLESASVTLLEDAEADGNFLLVWKVKEKGMTPPQEMSKKFPSLIELGIIKLPYLRAEEMEPVSLAVARPRSN